MLDLHSAVLRRIAKCSLWQFALILLTSRILLLILIRAVTHGHELTNDSFMHMDMIRSPLCVILYTVPQYEQHPPFLPLVETLLGYPLQFFLPDFLTIRLVMIFWETVLACLFFELLSLSKLGAKRRGWCLVAFVLLPTGWMTSTIMGQDDSIATCGILLPLVVYLHGHRRLALLLSGIGVVAAKLFVIFELFTLIPITTPRAKWRDRATDALLGFGPIILVYGALSLFRIKHHYPLPLVGFKPDQYFGTNFWIVLHRYANLQFPPIATYIGVLSLLAALIPVVLLTRLAPKDRLPTTICAALGGSLLCFFMLFYHVGPEYFMIAVPALLISSTNLGDALCCIFLSIIPWAGKFFQNAAFMYRAGESTGKAVALQAFQRIFHSSPETWLWVDQILFSLLTLYMCYRWCRKLTPSQASFTDPINPSREEVTAQA